MITDRIRRHEILLLINHKYDNMCDILGFFKLKLKNSTNSQSFFTRCEKKPFKCTTAMALTFLLQYPIISIEIRTVDSQSDLRILSQL